MHHNEDVAKLAYELTYHKFLMNKDKAHSLFQEMNVAEYIALHLISKTAEGQPENFTYLTDLADKLEMPLSGVSRMVTRLKEQGLVLWSHNGKGNEGTFVTITESGFRAMERQDERMEAYYRRVIEKFGRENLVRLLQQMEALEQTMDEVYWEERG